MTGEVSEVLRHVDRSSLKSQMWWGVDVVSNNTQFGCGFDWLIGIKVSSVGQENIPSNIKPPPKARTVDTRQIGSVGFVPNCEPTICMLQQKLRFIRFKLPGFNEPVHFIALESSFLVKMKETYTEPKTVFQFKFYFIFSINTRSELYIQQSQRCWKLPMSFTLLMTRAYSLPFRDYVGSLFVHNIKGFV